MKRLVVCSDGTWNSPEQKHPTNVLKMARMVTPSALDGTPQVVFYDQGVGTGNWVDRWIGGITGKGLSKNIQAHISHINPAGRAVLSNRTT